MTVKTIEGLEEWEEALDLEHDELAVVLLFNSEAEAGNSIRRDFDDVSTQFPGFDHYILDVASSQDLIKLADLEDVETPSLIAFRGSRQYGPAESISVDDLETVSDDIKAFLQGLPVSST
ncbi:hypothetical protein BCR35DRAFT_306788 [Leucosporidium creatinivorum]|uniref:Thioredoxin domain-containing protein n=1 Tax=Leucosporidium creatinivorum TaxID=106004 RepID=A0A1Y2ES00_9BASI|nr:hypothetical protein BCR35DRAFT_306788 [Leucosporidium creatinivorum]